MRNQIAFGCVQVKLQERKTKAATILENGVTAGFTALFRASVRELAALHRANKADDVEIRRLQGSTRKKLERIRENLGHVQAAC